MNQSQRKFLIDKIESNVKQQIDLMKSETIQQPPSLENYFYGLAISKKLEIMPIEHIKQVVCEKALRHTASSYSETWLGSNRGELIGNASVKLKIKDLFVVPDEYNKMWDDYYASRLELEKKIKKLEAEKNTLILRIHLASDKTLQKMISEIDDIGDISLVDLSLKKLLQNDKQLD